MTALDLFWTVRDLVDPRLRATHRAALFALVAFREQDGTIAPSAKQLVATTGFSRSTVLRAVEELEAWGLIRSTFRGWHRSSVYELTLPERSATGTSDAQTSTGETSSGETSPRKTSRPDTTLVRELDHPGPAVTPPWSGSGTLCGSSLRISAEDLAEEGGAVAPALPTLKLEVEEPKAKRAKDTRPKTERATRLPDDWRPTTEQLVTMARKKRVDARECLERFKNHFLSTPSNKGGLKLRWDLTFATWVDRDIADGKLAILENYEIERLCTPRPKVPPLTLEQRQDMGLEPEPEPGFPQKWTEEDKAKAMASLASFGKPAPGSLAAKLAELDKVGAPVSWTPKKGKLEERGRNDDVFAKIMADAGIDEQQEAANGTR